MARPEEHLHPCAVDVGAVTGTRRMTWGGRWSGKVSRAMIWGLSGWLLAIVLLVMVAPRAWQKLTARVSFLRAGDWERTVERKKAELAAAPWGDARPLLLFAGDSHVEMGNWYGLWRGRQAVQNAGLSQAKIEDVTVLAGAAAGRQVQTVALLCGINNLGAGETVESCEAKYAQLLTHVRDTLQPKTIVVVSVMPLRAPHADDHARTVNAAVASLNVKLQALCRKYGTTFAEVRAALSDPDGALRGEFSSDGLHLNPDGYRVLAQALEPFLGEVAAQP